MHLSCKHWAHTMQQALPAGMAGADCTPPGSSLPGAPHRPSVRRCSQSHSSQPDGNAAPAYASMAARRAGLCGAAGGRADPGAPAPAQWHGGRRVLRRTTRLGRGRRCGRTRWGRGGPGGALCTPLINGAAAGLRQWRARLGWGGRRLHGDNVAAKCISCCCFVGVRGLTDAAARL